MQTRVHHRLSSPLRLGLALLAVTSLATAGVVKPREKTLEELDAEAYHQKAALNDDAPLAVARVTDSGDIEDVLSGVDPVSNSAYSQQQQPVATSVANLTDPALSPAVFLTTKRPSQLHRIEGLFAYVGLREHAATILSISNVVAYAHLLLLTSRSHNFIMEIAQVVCCIFFPTLPLVQFLHNLLKTLATAVRHRASPPRSPCLFALASLTGQYVFPGGAAPATLLAARRRLADTAPRAADARPAPRAASPAWLAQLGLAALNALAAATALHMAADHPTRSDWAVAAIARDLRSVWLAGAGALSAALALAALAPARRRWALRPPAPAAAVEQAAPSGGGLLWEADLLTELALAALLQDAAAARAGAVSLLGLVAVLMANRLVLVALVLVVALFNGSVRGAAGELLGPPREKHTTARVHRVRPVAVVFSLALCACIFLFQMCSAVLEHCEALDEPWLLGGAAPRGGRAVRARGLDL